jgi:WD40 repeat protein
VFSIDTHTGGQEKVFSHELGVSKLVFDEYEKQLITGSWDKTLRFYDPRTKSE